MRSAHDGSREPSAAAAKAKAAAWAILVFALSLAVLAPLLLFGALMFAGPHSDLLPGFVQPLVVIAAWTVLLGVPYGLARLVYRRWASRIPGTR